METLQRKRKTRVGWVYIRKRASGPPQPKNDGEEAIDDLVRDAAVNFDFSPVFAGDPIQAQRVADDFIAELRALIVQDESLEAPDEEDLQKRVNVLWPFWYRSINKLRDRLRTALGPSARPSMPEKGIGSLVKPEPEAEPAKPSRIPSRPVGGREKKALPVGGKQSKAPRVGGTPRKAQRLGGQPKKAKRLGGGR